MKYSLWLGFFLLSLLVVAGALGADINISSGSFYNFSYVNASNETAAQGFLCLPNATSCAPLTVNVTLQGGEHKIVTNSYCTADVQCGNETPSANLCSLDLSIESGDTLTRTNGACDVEVRCLEPDVEETCRNINGNVTYTVPYRLFESGDTLVFEYDGQRQASIRKNGTINLEGQATYACPVNVEVEDLQAEYLFEACKVFLPSIGNTVDLLVQQGIQNGDKRTSCEDSRSTLQMQLNARIGELEASVAAHEEQNRALTTRANTCETDLAEKESSITTAWIFTVVFLCASIFLFAVVIILLVILWRKSRGEGVNESG